MFMAKKKKKGKKTVRKSESSLLHSYLCTIFPLYLKRYVLI